MEAPPAAPGVGAQTLALAVAAAAAAACSVEDKAKRARKRSRYLDDYEIPTLLNGLHHHHHCIVTPLPPPPPPPRKGPALLLQLQQANVATPDLLAALHRCAASPYDHPPGPGGVDAGLLLGFFDLHRASVLATTGCGKDTAVSSTDQHRSSKDDAAAAAAARQNPCRAMAVSNGSAGKEQADAVAMGHAAYAHHTGPAHAAALGVGGAGPSKRKKKKVTFVLGAPSAAGCSAQPPTHGVDASPALNKAKKKAVTFALGAAGTGCSAQPAATHIGSGITSSAPKKGAKNKKAVNSPKQGQHFGKPVALILQFAQGAADQPLPSKEQLHSTFRGFGPLIEPNTEITKKQARIVFQSSAAAEAAYSCVHTLGAFAAARLQYLRPPPPAPKIPLTDVRKNLEKMIASLTGPSLLGKDSAWNLAGEMQHLLVKVDRALNAGAGPSTSAAAHRY